MKPVQEVRNYILKTILRDFREEEITKENMRIFSKINKVVEVI